MEHSIVDDGEQMGPHSARVEGVMISRLLFFTTLEFGYPVVYEELGRKRAFAFFPR